MGFYEVMIVDGYEFPITIDGILTGRYQPKEREWRRYLQAVTTAIWDYQRLYPLISRLHGEGLGFEDVAPMEMDGITIKHNGRAFEYSINGNPDSESDDMWSDDAKRYQIQKAKAEILRSKKFGYVYLVRSVSGHYKIGRTKDPADRMKTFNVKLPFEIELLHTIESDDYCIAEELLHDKFALKRINGEWFALDDNDVAYIKSLESL
jgi:hypothetical protein